MTDKTKLEIIIIRGSIAQSIIKDLFVLATVGSMIGIGILLQSNALQWAGAAMAFIVIIARATASTKKMTVEEAKKYIASMDD